MTDYQHSTQVSSWLFTPELLAQVRKETNIKARRAISLHRSREAELSSTTINGQDKDGQVPSIRPNSRTPISEVQCYASGYASRATDRLDDDNSHATEQDDASFLTADEEAALIQFYSSKLFLLIGPNAQIPRLRRDVKVASTASLLFRRFYLSNSVMIHDPKALMVASAFLGSKVEDATVDIRYLEDGTKLMQAPVTIPEIITAELHLAAGINFDLLCFHPYKTVLAFTEDLRIFLKSAHGQTLTSFQDSATGNRPIVGEDLRPIHDEARKIVDDAVVSDIPLLASPGHTGLAAMMLANQDLISGRNNDDGQIQNRTSIPGIDFYGYIKSRFSTEQDPDTLIKVTNQMDELCHKLRGLREGKYGCGNHNVDMNILKSIHKKLKKCRTWGTSSDDGQKKKKKKKRKRDE